MPKLPDFKTLAFRAQVAVVAAGLALVGVGGYATLVVPKSREIRTLKTQLARQEPEPTQPAEPIPPIGEDERKLWDQLEARLRERFPAEKDLPGALKALAELARSAHLELIALSLQAPAAKSTGASAGVTVQVGTPSLGGKPAGSSPGSPQFRVPSPLAASPTIIKLTAIHRYQDLVEFLAGLDSLPVVVAVESLEVTRVENRLTTEMTLRTLIWPAS